MTTVTYAIRDGGPAAVSIRSNPLPLVTPGTRANVYTSVMFGQRETTPLQMAIPMVVGMIGLAFCTLALLDMRSQQADDRRPARPSLDTTAARQEPHHMRGWQLHRRDTSGLTQRKEVSARGLG